MIATVITRFSGSHGNLLDGKGFSATSSTLGRAWIKCSATLARSSAESAWGPRQAPGAGSRRYRPRIHEADCFSRQRHVCPSG